ncbi:NAD-dependent epimerase/dehydratase family protein [Pseudorhodoferax sp.]|uniref:NAD-dependent epimerase/dehydratase family protein n=1 Tax=Pseudorhodoferax sp. TaxID=1993553 RepID=UPI0039E6F8B0
MPAPAAPPIVLTGGSGFVGRAVVQALARRGSALRLAGRAAAAPVPLPPHVQTVAVAPLGPQADWSAALRGASAVLHLAARAHVLRDPAADPLAAYRAVNTAGTLRLAEQAAAAGVRRFVFASTVKVHGESTPADRPFTEDMAPAPQDPYALSKWEAEQGLAAIAARTGMEVVVVRPPLVYGPGVRANFAALVRAVARGWPLPLGAIDNRRSLVGLDNLVDLLLLCLEHPAAAQQTFLASDGEDLSTPALLRRLAAAMGRPARLLPVPPALLRAGAGLLGRGAAVERLCGSLRVDIAKARRVLGWAPPLGVDEGLRRTVQGLR